MSANSTLTSGVICIAEGKALPKEVNLEEWILWQGGEDIWKGLPLGDTFSTPLGEGGMYTLSLPSSSILPGFSKPCPTS